MLEFTSLINSDKVTAVYFSNDSCSVCKVIRPQLETKLAGMGGVAFSYIDTVESPIPAAQNMVFTVPTLVIYHAGKEVKRFSRFIDVEEVVDFLGRLS